MRVTVIADVIDVEVICVCGKFSEVSESWQKRGEAAGRAPQIYM
jgi:hypothetical protein